MSPEIQQALIGGGASIVGAFLGSGIVSYMTGIMSEKKQADISTYLSIKKLCSNNSLTYIKNADFFDGLPQWVVYPIYDIARLDDNKNNWHFHDRKLHEALRRVIAAAEEFSKEVPSRTTPEGQRPNAIITTMSNRSRATIMRSNAVGEKARSLWMFLTVFTIA